MPSSHEVKAQKLLEHAEQLGIRLEFDSGFVLVRRSATKDSHAADVLRTIIESLGQEIVAVRRLAIGRARAASAGKFIGERIFVPESEIIVGTLKSVDQDGNLTVSYLKTFRGEIERELTSSVRGDGCLIAVGSSEFLALSADFRKVPHRYAEMECTTANNCPRCALEFDVPQLAPQNIGGTTLELVNRAEKQLGMVFSYDSGLIITKWPEMSREQANDAEQIVRKLGARVVELHHIAAGRARAARAVEFVGQQVFVSGDADLGGWRIFEGADGTGTTMAVSLNRRGYAVPADNLLIVVDEEPASFSPVVAKPERPSLLNRVRGALTAS